MPHQRSHSWACLLRNAPKPNAARGTAYCQRYPRALVNDNAGDLSPRRTAHSALTCPMWSMEGADRVLRGSLDSQKVWRPRLQICHLKAALLFALRLLCFLWRISPGRPPISQVTPRPLPTPADSAKSCCRSPRALGPAFSNGPWKRRAATKPVTI
jgi:hypothetical protein